MKPFLIAVLLAGTTLFGQATTKKAATPPPAAAAKPAAQPAAAPTPVTTGFVGNKSSKVLHKSTCKMVASMKDANKVPFASKDEALKANYKPCKICNP
jgi:DNA-entry nuclease